MFLSIRDRVVSFMRTKRHKRFRSKLILGFASLALIGLIFGFYCISNLQAAKELVNSTYDQALMTSTYARSAQLNYANFNSEVKAAIMSRDPDRSGALLSTAEQYAEDARNDLDVVAERTLNPDVRASVRLSQQKIGAAVEEAKAMIDRTHKFEINENVRRYESWQKEHFRGPIFDLLSSISETAMEEGYLFRLSANLKSVQMIRVTIVVLIVFSILGFGIGWMLLYSALPPLARFNEACVAIVSGDIGNRVDVRTNDEFGELASVFNNMMDQLQERGRNLLSLLSSLPDAVFSFNQEGRISKERSPKTHEWFDEMSDCATITDFFRLFPPENKKDISRMLGMLWDPNMSNRVDVLLELFPHEISFRKGETDLALAVSYYAQRGVDDRVERIIVVIRDRSNEVQAEKRRIAKDYEISRILNVLAFGYHASRRSFEIRNAATLELLEAPASERNLRDLKRVAHTLKGSLAVFGFRECSEMIHELESEIWKKQLANRDKIRELWARYLQHLDQQFIEVAQKTKLDESGEDQIRIPAHKLVSLEKIVGSRDDVELRRWAKSLQFLEIKDLLGRFAAYISTLQNEFKKQRFTLVTTGHSFEISRPQIRLVDTILIHLLRNAVVHGIEPTDERRVLGKDLVGSISIHTEMTEVANSQLVTIEVADDGRGLQVEKLRQAAIASGRWTESQAAAASDSEVFNLIFLPSVTLANDLDVNAGRGVGLDAVKDAVEALKAKLEIESKSKIGTRFKITFDLAESDGSLRV